MPRSPIVALQAASKEAALAIMLDSVRRSYVTGASNADSLTALSDQARPAPLPHYHVALRRALRLQNLHAKPHAAVCWHSAGAVPIMGQSGAGNLMLSDR